MEKARGVDQPQYYQTWTLLNKSIKTEENIMEPCNGIQKGKKDFVFLINLNFSHCLYLKLNTV